MKTARKVREIKVRGSRPVKRIGKAATVRAKSASARRAGLEAARRKRIASLPLRKRARKIVAKAKAKQARQVVPKSEMGSFLRKKTFRSRATLNGCSRRKLVAFAEGRMELDEKLDILYHLDRCQKCWDDLYLIRKSKNGRLYSRKTRSYSEADIKALEKENTQADEEDALAEAEDAFDVA